MSHANARIINLECLWQLIKAWDKPTIDHALSDLIWLKLILIGSFFFQKVSIETSISINMNYACMKGLM